MLRSPLVPTKPHELVELRDARCKTPWLIGLEALLGTFKQEVDALSSHCLVIAP